MLCLEQDILGGGGGMLQLYLKDPQIYYLLRCHLY